MALQLPPPGFDLWNWGFALGTANWGTGVFREAAELLLSFARTSMALPQVEAWILHANGRANSAISKLGAVPQFRANAKAPDGRVADFIRWTVPTRE
jgi:RimJ/RimL family protein N-acetyltransferase